MIHFVSTIALLAAFAPFGNAEAKNIKCENEINQFLGAWDLGSVDHPKGDVRPNGNSLQIGNLSRVKKAYFVDSEKDFHSVFGPRRKNGGVYHQNAFINQLDESHGNEIRVSRNGYVKSLYLPSENAKATYAKVIDIVLTPNCDLKKIVFPRYWKTQAMTGKGVAKKDSNGKQIMETRNDTLVLSAEKCRAISKLRGDDDEWLDQEIRKIINDSRFEENVDKRTHDEPFAAVKANCHGKGLLIAMLPKSIGEVAAQTLQKGVQKAVESANKAR